MRKIIIVLFACIVGINQVGMVKASNTLRIFYAGQEGAVKAALRLAPVDTFTFVDDPAQADVFVINGETPRTTEIAARIEAGAGLLFIPTAQTDSDTASLVLGIPVTLARKDNPISLTEVNIDDPLVREIVWNSAPQARERFEMLTPLSSVQPLVTAYEDGAWVLWQVRPQVYVFNVLLDAQSNTANWILQAIDPATGEVLQGSERGLLPPNNAQGAGRGLVSYRVRPHATAATGTRITASARVILAPASSRC